MEMWLLAIAVLIVTLLVMWVFISAVIFILQELNHSLKNFKRAVREFMWDLEWKFRKRG